jgi:uncharacterized protein (TIGR02284 family)
MATLTERDLVNGLIETCRDAERGFRDAAALVEDDGIKNMFLKMACERARFAMELAPHAQRLGGPDAGDGTAAATWHRRWMQLRNRVTSVGDVSVVAEAGRGDAVSLSVYDEAMHNVLPPATRELVERQHGVLRHEHSLLVALRDSMTVV